MVSGFCISFLIFIDWKKGPDWWLKISPFVFYTMLFSNYILVPIVNIIPAIWVTVNPSVTLKNFTIGS